jgi:hypothetical protein
LSNIGMSRCIYCGAEYRLVTISNRDMQGLCKAWKARHENKCKFRSPMQRRKWAKPYFGKNSIESSIVVDMKHSGFTDPNASESLR